jgi:hypothetical protein
MWLWVATAWLIVPGMMCAYYAQKWIRHYDYRDWHEGAGVFLAFAAAILILIGTLLPITTLGERAINHVQCRSFGHKTGREVKFVLYTDFSGGDCLTRSSNGKWISIDNLREFADK